MSESDNIRVICRFRPVNDRERAEMGGDSCKELSFEADTNINVAEFNGRSAQVFTFDKVFSDPKTTQVEVYELAAKESIDNVIKGYNSTIFAYGQTGAGKSFTMFGPDIAIGDLQGIIPRACSHIFHHISEDDKGTEYTIKCSFLEIYREVVRDLLNPSGRNLRVRETPQKGVWVEGLREEYVSSVQDVLDLIKEGETSRATSATNMNAVSSRSHSLFILTLHQKNQDGSTLESKLNLADLAGSEKVGKTGATGDTLEEAKKINQSLSALGNCINSLTKSKRGHVPYRDSKLTFILRESLGGNCKTTLLIACSPHIFNLEETISTLQFGKRAKAIKNVVTVNKQRSVAELMAIIEKIRKELSYYKRYVKCLETELERVKGPDWKEGLELPKAVSSQPKTSTKDKGAASQSEPVLAEADHQYASVSSPSEADLPSGMMSPPSRPFSPTGVSLSQLPMAGGGGTNSVAMAALEVQMQRERDKLQNEKAELDDEIRCLKEELDDAKSREKQWRKLEEEGKVLKGELQRAKSALSENESKWEYERNTLASKAEELQADVEAIRKDREETLLRFDELNGEKEKAVADQQRALIEAARAVRERDEYKHEVEDIKSRLENFMGRSQNLEKAKEELEASIHRSDTEIARLKAKSDSDQEYLETLKDKMRAKEESLDLLEEQKDNLEGTISELRAELQRTDEQLQHLTKARERAEASGEKEIASLKATTVSVEELQRLADEKERVDAELAKRATAVRTLEREMKKMKELFQDKEEELTHLQKNLEREQAEAKENLEDAEAHLKRMENKHEKILKDQEEQRAKLECSLETARSERRETEDKLEETLDALRAKENDLNEMQTKMERLLKALQEKEGLIDRQKNQLDSQSERLDTVQNKLDEATKEKDRLAVDLESALLVNAENARRFEDQLDAAFRAENLARKHVSQVVKPITSQQSPKSPWESLFGIKAMPPLEEVIDGALYKGRLMRRSRWLRTWDLRLFVLHPKKGFFYFNDNAKATDRALGQVECDGCKVANSDDDTGRKHTVGLYHPSRRDLHFQATSESESLKWVQAISSYIEKLSAPGARRRLDMEQ